MPGLSVSDPTSSSLIGRVKDRDPDAWTQLAELYGPLVYRWVRQCGLQTHDAADIVQEVFQSVAVHIDAFEHTGPGSTFRGWLWTITRNLVRQHFRKTARHPRGEGGSDAHARFQQFPQLLDDEQEPSGFDSRTALAHRALRMIEGEFETRTWRAFWRAAIEGHAPGDIADDLGMSPQAVRQAKYRVLCRLRELLQGEN